MKNLFIKHIFKILFFICINVFSQIRNEVHIPNILGYTTLKGDFHIHTVYSDGRVWPDIRVLEAWRDGLDVIGLTDHINYKGPVLKKAVKFEDENLPYKDAKTIADRLGITLVKGLEINKPGELYGHLNILFLKDINKLKPIQGDLIQAFKEAKKQGAFIQLNHPLHAQGKNPHWREFHQRAYDQDLLDGLEIYNNVKLHKDAIPWALEHNLTITASSDVHYLIDMRYFEGHRAMTLIFANNNTEESIKEAMLAKRTAVYYQDTIIGYEKHLKPLFNESVEVIELSNIVYRKKRYAQLKNKTDIRFVLEKVREDNGIEIPQRITLLPNTINLLEFTIKENNVIDKKSVKATYKVTNFKTLNSEPIEVEIVFNKDGLPVGVREPITLENFMEKVDDK